LSPPLPPIWSAIPFIFDVLASNAFPRAVLNLPTAPTMTIAINPTMMMYSVMP
jgi:hypothetical protein